MLKSGRVVFGEMEEVLFGIPAARRLPNRRAARRRTRVPDGQRHAPS